jgi:hypothetical protein
LNICAKPQKPIKAGTLVLKSKGFSGKITRQDNLSVLFACRIYAKAFSVKHFSEGGV